MKKIHFVGWGVWGVGVALGGGALLGGCLGGNSSSKVLGDGGSCTQGTKDCSCTKDDTCNTGLNCVFGVCVGNGDSTGTSAGSTDSSGTTGGQTAGPSGNGGSTGTDTGGTSGSANTGSTSPGTSTTGSATTTTGAGNTGSSGSATTTTGSASSGSTTSSNTTGASGSTTGSTTTSTTSSNTTGSATTGSTGSHTTTGSVTSTTGSATTGSTTTSTTGSSGGTTGGGTGTALVPDSTGWVAATTNGYGVQGQFWTYSDATSCSGAGYTSCSSADLTIETGGFCVSGVVAPVPYSAALGDYDFPSVWGAGVGMDWNGTQGDPVVESPYDAVSHGVTGVGFTVTGTVPASTGIRVQFPAVGQEQVARYITILSAGTVTARFSQATVAYDPTQTAATNTTELLSLEWQVPTSAGLGAAFNFCVSNLHLLTN